MYECVRVERGINIKWKIGKFFYYKKKELV